MTLGWHSCQILFNLRDTNKDGKIDAGEAKAAAEAAWSAAKAHLGPKLWESLVSEKGGSVAAEQFLSREIEAAVARKKAPLQKKQ